MHPSHDSDAILPARSGWAEKGSTAPALQPQDWEPTAREVKDTVLPHSKETSHNPNPKMEQQPSGEPPRTLPKSALCDQAVEHISSDPPTPPTTPFMEGPAAGGQRSWLGSKDIMMDQAQTYKLLCGSIMSTPCLHRDTKSTGNITTTQQEDGLCPCHCLASCRCNMLH